MNDSGQNSLNRRNILLRFVRYAGLILLLVSGFGITFYLQALHNARDRIALEEMHHLQIKARAIAFNLKQVGYSMLFLADQVRLHKPFTDEAGRKVFADDMVSFLNTTELYDQLRLLDMQGHEVERANYNNGHPALVPRDQLQDKSRRYYFRQAIRLGPNDLFISPLDLNIEHGVVEVPFKPTIRLSMPVFAAPQQKVGLLVLNYQASHLLKLLREQVAGNGKILMLNRDGYWLVGPSPQSEWGFVIEARRQHNLAQQQPELWRAIRSSESGTFDIDNMHYVFSTIYPFRDLARIPKLTLSAPPDEYFWKLLVRYPDADAVARVSSLRHSLGLWSAIFAMLLLSLAWLYSVAIEKRNHSEQRLRYLAYHDELTGLTSRARFMDRLEHTLALARRHRTAFAVLYLDLDRFKPINDRFGHAAGDRLLRHVARTLIGCVREIDTVARLGGDEFAIVLAELQAGSDAEFVADKILQALAEPFTDDDRSLAIGCSIGIAVYPDDGDDSDHLLRCADQAMYQAKQEGRNRYCFYQRQR